MSNIDKQVLREAAEKALSARERLALMESVFEDDGEDVKTEAQDDISICISFNELTNPATVLALLDELEDKDIRIEEEIGRANREHHRGFMMACGHLKEHSKVHYADAAEMEIAALRKRISELESAAAGKGE